METAQQRPDESNLQIANTLFPPPPAYYKAFTETNLSRYGELRSAKGKERAHPQPELGDSMIEARGSSDDEIKELEKLGGEMEKPRVDWIREDGRWMCFGQMHTVGVTSSVEVRLVYEFTRLCELQTEPNIPTAASLGIPPLIDPDEPPQTSLPPLLRSFLHTLLLLVDNLTNTPRVPGELMEKGWAHEGDQYIQHLSNLAARMMVSANQLRGVQASWTHVRNR